MAHEKPTNSEIADVLDQIADLLERKGANAFRVQAYHNGADTVRSAEEPLAQVVEKGDEKALRELPNIGEGIARIIATYVRTGRSDYLERLKGEIAPEEVFTQVPGIGEELAQRLAEELDIRTLQELEQAAHDGRLEKVEGFGPKRVRSIELSLAGMLSSAARRQRRRSAGEQAPDEVPDVAMLLDVDEEYRRKAEAGELRKIAPKRFNPQGEAWLPILHTSRGAWDVTALYSNTARAHELDKTHDWVVLYFERDGEEDQTTVVTETHGALEGERVVRGREAECRRYYEEQDAGES
jgi:Holliday junction resolvasome RuvABC DNA-binding subunit